MQEFGGRARFVEENYGESELARRLGVTRYPAVFVGDVLVATPNDFGFYGRDDRQEGGRYAPLRSAASHARFRADLSRMITLLLAGQADAARAVAAPRPDASAHTLPDVALADLDGRPIPRADLAGRVVLVEFWATWCPPCRGTLRWLGDIERRYGDRVTVVAVAVESPDSAVRDLTEGFAVPVRWVRGTPEIARAFGDVSAVPTLHVFDRGGRAAGSFFGAPPDLHARAGSLIDALLE